MSIINNAHAGSSVLMLRLIDTYLISIKPKTASKQKIEEICKPENLPKTDNARKKFLSNLNFWIEQGLWFEKDGEISISDEFATESNLSARVLKICIDNCRDNDVTDKNNTTIEPFLRCVACLLAQDKFAFGGQTINSGQGGIDLAINDYLPQYLAINKTNEGGVLRDYSRFLGFIEPIEKDAFILDPTRAILPVLPSVFSSNDVLGINTFIDNLANVLPVLDRGAFRTQVEKLMLDKGWEPPSPNEVSASLSHALERLEVAEVIAMSQRSDDKNQMSLKTLNNRSVGTITLRKIH